MKKRKESKTQNIDKRLIKRLRFYLFVMVVLLIVIVLEVVMGNFSIIFALVGIIIGLIIGAVVSRIYNLSWDEETNNVVGNIDLIGLVILVCYLGFILTKTQLLAYLVQGNSLSAMILGVTAGTMMGRVISTKKGIEKVFKVLEIRN
jgi:uncharacterized membrane protein